MKRPRPCVVFAVDGVLLDVRLGLHAVVQRLSGCTLQEVARFKAAGGYDDDWELARAAAVWVRARRPLPIPDGGWRRMVNLYGGDPGDLGPRCRRLYLEEYWRKERPLLDAARLERLSRVATVGACTARNREELARAEELLGFHFPAATTREDARRPDAEALLRLGPTGHYLGVGEDDRRTAAAAGYTFHAVEESPTGVVDRLLAELGG